MYGHFLYWFHSVTAGVHLKTQFLRKCLTAEQPVSVQTSQIKLASHTYQPGIDGNEGNDPTQKNAGWPDVGQQETNVSNSEGTNIIDRDCDADDHGMNDQEQPVYGDLTGYWPCRT